MIGLVSLGALIVTVTWALAAGGGSDSDRDTGGRSDLELVWSDEFDGEEGAFPGDHWRALEGGGGWGNEEWQIYSSRPENVSLDGDGHLRITARREPDGAYTSARIETRPAFRYGIITARINAPAGQGLWPAFWTLGEGHEVVGWPRAGEIDIMELRNQADEVHANVHLLDRSQSDGRWQSQGSYAPGESLAGNWHVYGAEWSPEQIIFTLDGREYHRVSRDDLGPDAEWPFDNPQVLLLNVAVGGTWPGPPDDATPLPATMLVDYVRIEKPV